MVTDTSEVLYLCPISGCGKASRDEDEIKRHIKVSKSGGHSGINGFTMERPIPERYPRIEKKDLSEWKEDIRVYAEDNAKDVAGPHDAVDHRKAAEELELPPAFCLKHIRKLGYTFYQPQGGKVPAWRWEDLSDAQQSTLLAWAYFPDMAHDELAEMGYSGHATQSSVSKTIRDYGWMFSDPSVQTPITAKEPKADSGGEVTIEGVPPMYSGTGTARKASILDTLTEEVGAGSSGDEPRGSEAEEPVPEPDVNLPPGEYVEFHQDVLFDIFCALIETDRHSTAEAIWIAAVAEEDDD